MAAAYSFPYFSLIGSFLGFALMIFAIRFHIQGNERFCKKCRYLLTGLSDENTQCPECGNDLNTPKAITIGKRKTHWCMAIFGLCICIACTANIGFYVYKTSGSINWMQYKPQFWLEASAVNEFGKRQGPNTDELVRRITENQLSATQSQQLVEEVIKLQAQNPKWRAPRWQRVLGGLLKNRAFSPDQLKQLVEQAYQLKVRIRPALRQGEYMGYRFSENMPTLDHSIRFQIYEVTRQLYIGDQLMVSEHYKDPGKYRSLGINSSTATSLKVPSNFSPLNQTLPSRMTITTRLQLTEPVTYDPFEVSVTESFDVKVFEKDAIVDTFIKDESKQYAMAKSWGGTRVTQQDNTTTVLMHINTPPIGLAMAAWVIDGDQQHRIGTFDCDALYVNKWFKVDRKRIPPLSEKVIVALRPDQSATRYRNQLGEFWGLEMRSVPVTVNAPYHPPFNRDLSLIEPLKATLSLISVKREKKDELHYTVMTRDLPVRINCFQQALPNTKPERHHSDLRVNAMQGNCSYGERTPVDPDAQTVDLIFNPNPQWETDGHLDNLPWGYPIIFRNVPVPPVGQEKKLELIPQFILDTQGNTTP